MRRTITISVSEELYDYIQQQGRDTTVSEYIRSVIMFDRRRRADYASRPVRAPRTVNDAMLLGSALEQIDKLKAILEGRESFDEY